MDRDTFEFRIFENLDYLRDKIDDLCDRTVRTEEKLDAHLAQAEKKVMSNTERIKWAAGIAAELIVVKLSEFL